MEICNPDHLRYLASTYHDLLTHEKSLDYLIDLLQKDQLHNSLSLNALDKTISFYEVTISRLTFSFDKNSCLFSIFIKVI
jgi:hypothetical protein